MTAADYEAWQIIAPKVYATTIGSHAPKYETAEARDLLAAGWIKPGKTEQKAAGWITPAEHPDGLLCKPCPVCGYAYGTSWNYEEVPSDVIAWLQQLPETDAKPAWI